MKSNYNITEPDKSISVYVHIPFCRTKCPYCDFRSDEKYAIPENRYVKCLIKELDATIKLKNLDSDARRLSTIYFGGGTPSLLSPGSVGRLIAAIKDRFECSSKAEITLEANPETIDADRLDSLLSAGVNRLSIGVQSLENKLLDTLGRSHTARRALLAIASAKARGFMNVGVDVMFGIPGQTLKDHKNTLAQIIELNPSHVSVYGLTIEENTRFHYLYGPATKKTVTIPMLPGEETELKMYELTQAELGDAGYEHYEISNYARPGHKSVHNTRYWLGHDYIGLGVSAHSYMNRPGWGVRTWNELDVKKYMESCEETGSACAGGETLTKDQALIEKMMLGLRMLDVGIHAARFKAIFYENPRIVFPRSLNLEKDGFIRFNGEDILLTQKGSVMANSVFHHMLGTNQSTHESTLDHKITAGITM